MDRIEEIVPERRERRIEDEGTPEHPIGRSATLLERLSPVGLGVCHRVILAQVRLKESG